MHAVWVKTKHGEWNGALLGNAPTWSPTPWPHLSWLLGVGVRDTSLEKALGLASLFLTVLKCFNILIPHGTVETRSSIDILNKLYFDSHCMSSSLQSNIPMGCFHKTKNLAKDGGKWKSSAESGWVRMFSLTTCPPSMKNMLIISVANTAPVIFCLSLWPGDNAWGCVWLTHPVSREVAWLQRPVASAWTLEKLEFFLHLLLPFQPVPLAGAGEEWFSLWRKKIYHWREKDINV